MNPATETIAEVRRRYEPEGEGAESPPHPLPKPRSMAKLNIVLGGAFTAYVLHQRRELKRELAAHKGKISDKTLYEMNKRLFDTKFERVVATFVPALLEGMVAGVQEARLVRSSPEMLQQVAQQYAARMGSRLHETSTEALMQGFRAQVNRNVTARVAAERVIDAFGVAPKTMKSLVNIWMGKPVKVQTSARVKTPWQKDHVDTIVADAIMDRAKVIGDTESYQAKNMAKSIMWIKDAKDGKLEPTARVVWYTRRDERVCDTCGPMHGKYRKPDSPWRLPDGSRSWGPQVHPRCRCEQILVPEVTQTILRMTLQQAEMFEGGQAKELASPELVSKAFTVEGKYDKYSRDSGGRFASTDTRQRRTNRGISVKDAPTMDAGVARILGQHSQVMAQPAELAGQGVVAPRQSTVAPRTQGVVAPRAQGTVAPRTSVVAPRDSAVAPAVASAQAQQRQVTARRVAPRTVAQITVAPKTITARTLDVNEVKITQEVVAEIAQDIQAKAEAKTTANTKWVKAPSPMFSVSFPDQVLDFEDNIVTDHSQEFYEGATSPQAIDAQLAAYWEDFAESRIDSIYSNHEARAMGDEDRFFDYGLSDEAAAESGWDSKHNGVIFYNESGEELIVNREDYRRIFHSAFGLSGDDYENRVVEDLLVRDGHTREEFTRDFHVDELLQDWDFASEVDGYVPILLVTEYLNTEESTTPSSDGGTSIPGRWRATGTIHNSPTTELPCDIIYVEPEDL